MNELIVTEDQMKLVESGILNRQQLQFLVKKTPPQYVRERPAKGGGTWKYVTSGYVKKCLNLMFGWNWDFEVIAEMESGGEVIVKGRLTCRSNGMTIVKNQFGNKEIVYKKDYDKTGVKIPLSIGNDYKAAASDALKKCAAEIGIAADIYNASEFREVTIIDASQEDLLDNLIDLLNDPETDFDLTEDDRKAIKRVIDNKESVNYLKALNLLKTKKI